MLKNTPYILVTHEAMPLLHFCAHSFFPYTSSTPTLMMTLCLGYTASHSRSPPLYKCSLPVVYATHQ